MDIASATAFVSSTLTSSGLTIAPEALAEVAQRVSETVERDASGRFSYLPEAAASAFRIVAGEVVEVPVGEHLASLFRENAKPIIPEPALAADPAPTSPVGPTWARGRSDHLSSLARAFAASEDARIIREAQDWPNPYLEKNFNRTRQAVLQNKLPELAARYKAEAGR